MLLYYVIISNFIAFKKALVTQLSRFMISKKKTKSRLVEGVMARELSVVLKC